MKKIVFYLLLSIGLGCQPADISPDDLDSFEYRIMIGFVGQVYTIRVTQQETTLRLGDNKPTLCTTPTTPQEWKSLINVTRSREFRKYKSVKEVGCCDRGSEAVFVTGRGKTYVAENELLPRDSSSIGKLTVRLKRRMDERIKICP